VLLARTPEAALPALAGRADALAFGPDRVDPGAAAAYWEEVDVAREGCWPRSPRSTGGRSS
jgi:hypothetical protein